MVSDKVLNNILNYANKELPNTNFNPLTDPKTAENVAVSLCKALSITSDTRGSTLKANLRKSIIELTQNLSRNKHSTNILHGSKHSRVDILLKHILKDDVAENGSSRKYRSKKERRIKLYEELNLHWCRSVRLSSLISGRTGNPHINVGIALVNLQSDVCNEKLNNIVKECLNQNIIDDDAFQLLKSVWEQENLVVSTETYDSITAKLSTLLETKLLQISWYLIETFSDQEKVDDDIIKRIVASHFQNYNILMDCCTNDPYYFQKFFYILTDIYIRSNYNPLIQQLITSCLEEMLNKSLTDNLVSLYPSHLVNVALLLEADPESMKFQSPDLYNYTLGLLAPMFECSQFEFVFLLSHFTKWLSHMTPEVLVREYALM